MSSRRSRNTRYSFIARILINSEMPLRQRFVLRMRRLRMQTLLQIGAVRLLMSTMNIRRRVKSPYTLIWSFRNSLEFVQLLTDRVSDFCSSCFTYIFGIPNFYCNFAFAKWRWTSAKILKTDIHLPKHTICTDLRGSLLLSIPP